MNWLLQKLPPMQECIQTEFSIKKDTEQLLQGHCLKVNLLGIQSTGPPPAWHPAHRSPTCLASLGEVPHLFGILSTGPPPASHPEDSSMKFDINGVTVARHGLILSQHGATHSRMIFISLLGLYLAQLIFICKNGGLHINYYNYLHLTGVDGMGCGPLR